MKKDKFLNWLKKASKLVKKAWFQLFSKGKKPPAQGFFLGKEDQAKEEKGKTMQKWSIPSL